MKNSKKPNTQKLVKDPKQKRSKIIIIVLVVTGLYFLSLFVPVVKAYTLLPVYLIKCGHVPIAASTFTDTYYVPGSKAYRIHPFVDRYFCSEQEAKAEYFHYYNYNN